jgi:hypothetical protein
MEINHQNISLILSINHNCLFLFSYFDPIMDIKLYLSKLISDITLILDITKHMSKNLITFQIKHNFRFIANQPQRKG